MTDEGELEKRSKENRQITELFFLGDVDIETKKWVSIDDIDEAKKEITHAIFSGTDLELREVLHKWFGWFGDSS